MKDIVATQIRLPASLHAWMKQEAEEIGVPLNSFLVILLDRGRRLWEADEPPTPDR